MGKYVYTKTWGCQMNLHKSEGINGVLAQAGYEVVDSPDSADIILFNTCAVRQKSEEKVYGALGGIQKQKANRDVVFGVGGCIAQVKGERLLKRFPIIDFVFGTTELDQLPVILQKLKPGRQHYNLPRPDSITEIPAMRDNPVTAMVNISEGCSNVCSYCIVPQARGPLRSRSPANIIEEVENLVEEGYQEVLLLGQNVDSYGRDNPAHGCFSGLLEQIAQTGIARIRFISSHPRDMTGQVIKTIAAYENICNHIHLACQSGSDRVLELMNRGYTADYFLRIVDSARQIIPEVNITTDIIVGHPGETEEDFAATLRLINEARFGSIYVAKYSPRPGTRSASMDDNLSEDDKSHRLQQVLARQRQIAIEQNRRFIGKMVRVLVEERAGEDGFYGRADDHRTIIIDGDATIGGIFPVYVDSVSAESLAGRVCEPIATRGAP